MGPAEIGTAADVGINTWLSIRELASPTKPWYCWPSASKELTPVVIPKPLGIGIPGYPGSTDVTWMSRHEPLGAAACEVVGTAGVGVMDDDCTGMCHGGHDGRMDEVRVIIMMEESATANLKVAVT